MSGGVRSGDFVGQRFLEMMWLPKIVCKNVREAFDV